MISFKQFQILTEADRVPVVLKTPGASIQYEIGRIPKAFEISVGEAKITGFTSNMDFPGEMDDVPTRGEIYYVEVPASQKGVGYSLAVDALRVISANGSKTVNMNGVSAAGRRIIEKLKTAGEISGPIKTAKSGKAEYIIGREESLTEDYPSKWNPSTTITKTEYEMYSHSECWDFACAAHEITGWPTYGAYLTEENDDGSKGDIVHAVVKVPDREDTYLDVGGLVSLDDLKDRYDTETLEMKPVKEGYIVGLVWSQREIEEAKDVVQRVLNKYKGNHLPEFKPTSI